jgi:putative membrane protein
MTVQIDNEPEPSMSVILTWVINALALLIITYLVPSIHIKSFGTALIVAVVLGLINTVIRPVLILLTLPVTIVLWVFILVVNALCFWFASSLLKGSRCRGSGRRSSVRSCTASCRGCCRR